MKELKLCARLKACADFVSNAQIVADIGTDHALLPIYLLRHGLSKGAIACDLRPGPLKSARANIRLYGLDQKISCRLSDGLDALKPEEIDTVIIAGLGGESIIKIIENSFLLEKDNNIKIILQPMSKLESLRLFLRENSLFINEEKLVLDRGHIYTVMELRYSNELRHEDYLYEYMGAINTKSLTEELKIYISVCIKKLNNKLKARLSDEKRQEINIYISELRKILGKNSRN